MPVERRTIETRPDISVVPSLSGLMTRLRDVAVWKDHNPALHGTALPLHTSYMG